MAERSKSKKRSADEWVKILEAYESRDCTKAEFLKRHGIKTWALNYHLDKAREKEASFTPVAAATAAAAEGEVAIEFPSGIRLVIRG